MISRICPVILECGIAPLWNGTVTLEHHRGEIKLEQVLPKPRL